MRRVILVIVLIVFWLYSDCLTGSASRPRRSITISVNTIPNTGNVSIVEKSYEKGWLNSKAKTIFAIKNGGAELIKFEETDTIYHGPFPLQAVLSGRAGLTPVMAVIDSKLVPIPVGKSEFSRIIKKLPPAIY